MREEKNVTLSLDAIIIPLLLLLISYGRFYCTHMKMQSSGVLVVSGIREGPGNMSSWIKAREDGCSKEAWTAELAIRSEEEGGNSSLRGLIQLIRRLV